MGNLCCQRRLFYQDTLNEIANTKWWRMEVMANEKKMHRITQRKLNTPTNFFPTFLKAAS